MYPFCSRLGWTLLLVTVTGLAAGCRKPAPPSPEPPIVEPAPLEPVVPPNYRKIAPAPLDTPAALLSQTAVIVSGRITDVAFTYDDCAGARTTYVFGDAVGILGATAVPRDFVVKAFGGPMPDGRWARSSANTPLALGADYVIFLRNTDWTFSPIVSNLAFRREQIDGRELLIGTDGRALTGWTDEGPLYSSIALSGAVGAQQVGYRRADTPRPEPGAPSESTSPDPSVGRPPAAPGANAPAAAPGAASQPTSAAAAPAGAPSPAAASAAATSRGIRFAHAPTSEEIRIAGLFARPASIASLPQQERPLTVEGLTAAVRTIAERSKITIGGRLTLEPFWRCVTTTPTRRGR